MSLPLAFLAVAAGILTLVAGGETMLRGAVRFAVRLNISAAVIGMTIVAVATSIPELAVSTAAALKGSTEIAIANVVGSNIFNIFVILGLCAVIRPLPVTQNAVRLEYPILAISALIGLAVVADGKISRFEGALCLIAYAFAMASIVKVAKRASTSAEKEAYESEVEELDHDPRAVRLSWCFALVAAGAALLALGSHLTVLGAVEIARAWGWSERLIGLTIVSAGTGLPEVVASVVSSIRGRSDIALGNVVGSNTFNTLVIFGVGGTVSPVAVPKGILSTDLWWMLGATFALLPMILGNRRLVRAEGWVLILGYVAYLTLLIRQA